MKPRFIDIPDSWDELTPKQFEYLLKSIFLMMSNKKISTKDVLNDFADFLLGRSHPAHPLRREDYLSLVDKLAGHLAEWIFTDEEGAIKVDFCTTTNLLPKLGKLAGPVSHGSDLRFGEYRKAVEVYNLYTTTHNEMYLDMLVGMLYRPQNKMKRTQNFSGDYKIPFNKFCMDIYRKNGKNIASWLKWGVYLWFSYFCYYLMTGDFIIEGNTVNFSKIFGRSTTDSDSKQSEGLGMTSILFSLADSGTFGNVEETDKALLFQVMMKLYHDKQQIDFLNKNKK